MARKAVEIIWLGLISFPSARAARAERRRTEACEISVFPQRTEAELAPPLPSPRRRPRSACLSLYSLYTLYTRFKACFKA